MHKVQIRLFFSRAMRYDAERCGIISSFRSAVKIIYASPM